MSLPTVAIVGRPNVGKSTFVNRVLGRRAAIVEERPGVTRDRKDFDAEWAGHQFVVIDTGGWMPSRESSALDDKVSRQSERAIREADVAIMIVDARVGVMAEDSLVADLLRRRSGPTYLAANKVDDPRHEVGIWDFMELGLGTPYAVSALHGRGSADLLDEVVSHFPELAPADEADASPPAEPGTVGVAIVGRPNVGKSTLFNNLIGEDRAVVHDQAGTTRDSVDTVIETDLGRIRFIDTAGMRRRARIDEETEYYSMVRALQSIDKADVALLVIDATVGITHQDQRLAERVDAAGCPVVVILNKWELLDAEQKADIDFQLERKLKFLGDVPVMKISAITGKGVHRLFPILAGTITDYKKRVPTRDVNRIIRQAQAAHPAPGGARVLYATQGATDPPTFTLFANRELHRTYVRYLENQLRAELQLGSVPIKLRVRRRSE